MAFKDPPMRFNPGLEKYEPDLPKKEKGKEPDFDWVKFIFILLGIIAVAVVFYFLAR